MKKIGIIGLILLVTSGCNESEKSIEEPVSEIYQIPEIIVSVSDLGIKKKQTGEMSYNGLPFSGYLVEKYPNDSISAKIGYYDGKQNGMTTAFYQDGTIKYQRTYLNGEKHGTHIGFHQNGVKAFEYHFVNGFNEGKHKEWFNTGMLEADMNYVNGKEFGKQQVWRPDGKPRSNYIVRENGRRYGLQGIKRCTKLDGVTKTVDPYKGN